MKKNLLIIWILSILFNYEAFSSHAAGMDITYKYVGTPAGITGRQITLNVTSGGYPNEISWDIYDPSSATIINSGGAPYSGTVCIPTANLGSLQFRMYDSWGDGWNGATYTLSGNGTLTGTTTGGLTGWTSYGVNTFNVTGGTTCTTTETLLYEITLNFYMDCQNATSGWGSPPYNSIDIKYEKMSGGSTSSWISLPFISGPVNVTPVCSGITNPCNTNQLAYAYEKYTYKTIITLPSRDSWKIWNNPIYARNATTYGSIGTAGNLDDLCVIANINNTIYLNSSPVFNSDPISFLCTGGDCFFNGATDVDLDDISYSLTQPKTNQGNNANMTYQGGATYLQPFPSGSATALDPLTGDLCITTNLQGTSVAAIKVSESRNGTNLGYVTRDIQLWTRPCSGVSSSTVSVTTGGNTIFNSASNSFSFCPDGSTNLTFDITATSTVNIEMLTSVLPTGATFTANPATPLSSDTITGTISWTPTAADIAGSPYVINLIINDDECPIPNSTSETYTIYLTNVDASATFVQPTCGGMSDGSITVTATGGSPTYQYSDDSGITWYLNNIFTGLTQGTYTIDIQDANNCPDNITVTVTEPTQINNIATFIQPSCNGYSDGSITITATGGSPTYQYSDDSGITWYLNNIFTSLTQGTYTIDIQDANNCPDNITVTVTEPTPLIASVGSTTNVSCGGMSDGEISITVVGSTPSYQYSIDNGVNWYISNIFSGLSVGTYTIDVQDANNCPDNITATITALNPILVIVDTFRVSCFGLSDGSAILTISGGAGAPYITDWGGINPNSLAAGSHIITVTDVNNCSAQVIVIITEPSDIQITPLTSNVNCFGDINGSAALQISGGVAPYSQTWFGIDSSFLAPGVYPYQVVDNNNCVKNGNVTIYEADTLRASASIVDVNCYGDNNGAVNLNITGGTAPYIADFGSFNQYALTAGTYPFTITDINGCKFDSIAIVNQANQIFLEFIATSPICRYDKSTLSIHISNSTSNIYTISLEDSVLKSFVIDTNGLLIAEGVPIILTPNFSGEVYILSLTDNNGCEGVFNDDVHIEVKQLPVLNLNEDDICVGSPSFILNQATPYAGIYFINDEMTNYFDVENLEPGDYNIRYEYTDLITSCYNEIKEIITISKSPEAGLLFSPQPTDMNDPNIFFRDNSNDMLTSVWDLGDGTIIDDELSFWHTYSDIGTYIIKYYITNQYNCTDSIIENLVINPVYNTYLPTAFTPNNDDDNDYFYPSTIGENNYNMKIYDRWGGIIYNEDNGKWDGTQNGKMVNNGLYTYSMLVYDFKNKPFIYTGLVTLIK